MREHPKGRLETLDALRGAAALMVVVHHLGTLANGSAPVGYLAVDFFFVLSGFVISRAYEERLASGLTLAGFMQLRMVRLYPVFFAGLVLGLMVAGARIVTHETHAISGELLGASSVFGAFMLPTPGAPDATYPLNFPSWSLFFELAACAVYGAVAPRISTRGLICVIAIAAIGIVVSAVGHGTLNVGDTWATFGDAVVRTVFSFSAGVLIQRLSTADARASLWCLAPAAALVGGLAAHPAEEVRALYEIVFVLVVSPALVANGARVEPPPQIAAAARLLGEISYPLYAIHMPLIFMTGFVAGKLAISAQIWAPLYCVGVVAGALLLSRVYDQPVRAWLGARLRRARPGRAVAMQS